MRAELARSLAQQNYLPERDAGTAELCIVVHWGTTTAYVNPRGQFDIAVLNGQVANTQADPGLTNLLQMEREGHRDLAAAAINDNAVLLGYAATLEKERVHASPSSFERDLVDELNERRYFVVLMAYDLAFLRTEHRPKLLWTARLSMRSPGNNFTEALPALSEAGGRIFGRQLDGLAHVKGSWQQGHVILHELEVLGVERKDAAPVKSGK